MSDTIVIDTPEQIGAYRILAIRAGLRLEARGMRRSGRSCLAIARGDGLTNARNAKDALKDLDKYIKENLGI